MQGRDDNPSPYSFWERQIKTNVDYESLMQSYPYDHKLIDELIAIMVETVMSNRKMIRIAGDDYPFSVVKEKFLGIDYSHIQYIVDCFNEAAGNTEIRNVKQYMKTLIFNAPTTIDSYFTAKVRYDMHWLGLVAEFKRLRDIEQKENQAALLAAAAKSKWSYEQIMEFIQSNPADRDEE